MVKSTEISRGERKGSVPQAFVTQKGIVWLARRMDVAPDWDAVA